MRNITLDGREKLFLLTACIFATLIVLAFMDTNSINPDEANYLLLGKNILKGEYFYSPLYPYDFTHRPPLVPSVIALLNWIGFDITLIRILIPVIFINSALVSAFFLVRTLYGQREAFLAVSFLFAFPSFWRWGLSVLSDIPLITFSSLFFTFFYLGVEREARYFPYAAFFLSLAFLTKISAAVLIFPAFLYMLYRKKLDVVATKNFVGSAFIFAGIIGSVFLIFHVLTSAQAAVGSRITVFKVGSSAHDVLEFLLAPVLILVPFGFSKNRKTDVFLGLVTASLIIFFVFTNFHARYLSPLYPVFGVFAALGYLRIKSISQPAANLLLVGLIAVTFTNSLYLTELEETSLWGADELTGYLNQIGGNHRVMSEYMPTYLEASTNQDIISAPRFFKFDGELVDVKSFLDVVISNKTHPRYSEYNRVFKERNFSEISYFTDEWADDERIEYVIISIYNEFEREPVKEYYHPRFGPLEIPFVERPYLSQRPPPDYKFHSELYKRLENSSKYVKSKEIYKDGQKIFIVYKRA